MFGCVSAQGWPNVRFNLDTPLANAQPTGGVDSIMPMLCVCVCAGLRLYPIWWVINGIVKTSRIEFSRSRGRRL